MLTTFIAFSLLVAGTRLLVGLRAGAPHRVRHRRGDRARADPTAARQVRAEPRHRHHRVAGRLRGTGRGHLRQRQPRLPGRLLAARPQGGHHHHRLLPLRRLHPHRRPRVDGRHPGAVPLHGAGAAHAGVGLPPRDRPAPRGAGGHPADARLGPGRHRRLAGRPAGGADERVRAVLHGPDPRLRLHGRRHRRPREPGRRAGRRADLGAVHLLRRGVPRFGPRTARRARPSHGRPDGPARGHLRPAERRGGSDVATRGSGPLRCACPVSRSCDTSPSRWSPAPCSTWSRCG